MSAARVVSTVMTSLQQLSTVALRENEKEKKTQIIMCSVQQKNKIIKQTKLY